MSEESSTAGSAPEPAIRIPAASDLDRKMPCPVCLEPIQKGARICINCKSDLSWKRFLSFGNTSLAIVTALVAVSAAVGPQLKKLFFEKQNSDISGVFVGETVLDFKDPPKVSILVTNNGTRTGAIYQARVDVHWWPAGATRTEQPKQLLLWFRPPKEVQVFVKEKSAQGITLNLNPPRDDDPRVMEFRKEFADNLRFQKEFLPPAAIANARRHCKLHLSVIDADGTENDKVDSEFGCHRLSLLLTNAKYPTEDVLLLRK